MSSFSISDSGISCPPLDQSFDQLPDAVFCRHLAGEVVRVLVDGVPSCDGLVRIVYLEFKKIYIFTVTFLYDENWISLRSLGVDS